MTEREKRKALFWSYEHMSRKLQAYSKTIEGKQKEECLQRIEELRAEARKLLKEGF